jgi:SAM-dependent methyltransferase
MLDPKSIDDAFPGDHARQVDAYYYLPTLPVPGGRNMEFVDLGAGPGNSFSRVKKFHKQLNWTGVDIEDSGPVRSRKRTDLRFLTYDGVNLPFSDESIDVVFSRQVLEHVRHPDALMKDIARILRPGGVFVGSVSQLEPFHSYSIFNFTFYGLCVVATDAGLVIDELRPGVDGLTLCTRNFFKFVLKQPVDLFGAWISGTSPLNSWIDNALPHETVAARNKYKVRMAGHICFRFEKPSDEEVAPDLLS